MKKLIVVLICLSAVIAAAYVYFQYIYSSGSDVSSVVPAKRKPGVQKPEDLLSLEKVEAGYRLQPDRRFTTAVQEVVRIVKGEPVEDVQVRFVDGKWQVNYGLRSVALLTEYPDFFELSAALTAWSNTVLSEHPLKGNSNAVDMGRLNSLIQSFDGMEAVSEADRLWTASGGNPVLLGSIARALAIASVQCLDHLTIADIIPARAFAALALAKTRATDLSLAETEALLAYHFGYEKNAQTIAQNLSADSAARAFVFHDDATLDRLAENSDEKLQARYLVLLRLTSKDDPDQYREIARLYFANDQFQLKVLKASADMDEFDWNKTIPQGILAAAAAEVSGEAQIRSRASELIQRLLKIKTSMQIRSFEQELAGKSLVLKGTILDEELYNAYYRSFFYSALAIQGLHYLDELSSVAATQAFNEELAEFKDGVAADLKRWYSHLSQIKQGKGDPDPLIDDILELKSLGDEPIFYTASRANYFLQYRDPRKMTLMKRLFKRQDTRPSDRANIAWAAYSILNDLPLAEKLYSSVNACAYFKDSYEMRNFAVLSNNSDSLREMMRSPYYDPADRASLIIVLGRKPGIRPEQIEEEYNRLKNEKPGDYMLRQKYVKYLKSKKDWAQIQRVTSEWIADHDRSDGFPYIFARKDLAEALIREKRYKEAWDAVGPVVSSYQSNALRAGAWAKEGLGSIDEAIELASAAAERYPDSEEAKADLMQIYWKQNRYQEAAEAAKQGHKVSESHWCWTIAGKYAEVFAEQDEKNALAAIEAIIKSTGSQYQIGCFAYRIGEKNRYDIAYQIILLAEKQNQASLSDLVTTYKYLRHLKGPAEARKWLDSELPKSKYAQFSWAAFRDEQYDLLWEVLDKPETSKTPELIWVYRAAASALKDLKDHPNRKILIDYYSSPDTAAYYEKQQDKIHVFRAGRHLLDLCTAEEVLSGIKTNSALSEAAYYLALKAQANGDYVQASKWYRLSVESGKSRSISYINSFDTLSNWSGADLNLASLAERKIGMKRPEEDQSISSSD